MDEFTEVLARNIGDLLHESRLTQEQFADKVGIKQQNLNRFLKGKAFNPTIKSLERIGKPFGKDVIWLLTDHRKEGTSKSALPPVRLQELVRELLKLEQSRADHFIGVFLKILIGPNHVQGGVKANHPVKKVGKD